MMKILHSADWHMDSPFRGFSPEQRQGLRDALLQVPGKICELCRREQCDLVLLAGDIFDGPYSRESFRAVYQALERMEVPVLVSPGNHDFMGENSPWNREIWPENVYIFTKNKMEPVTVPGLDVRIFGAGFSGMDCPPLLEGFRSTGAEAYQLGLVHGDPTQPHAPYNPINRGQVAESGLTYLALGHIHKADWFRAGDTLCAWPGCPMGRGYDETGEKGVYIAELDPLPTLKFVPLDTPRFWNLEADVSRGEQAVDRLLPSVGSTDYYRITLTGCREELDVKALRQRLSRFPNLELMDHREQPLDLWKNAGEDSFEGAFFGLLQQKLGEASPEEREEILLAAELSRRILEGQEVVLP